MKTIRSELALHRILDALEAELLAMPADEIQAVVAETGMSARALLSDRGARRGPSRDQAGGDSTPHPDLWSDLPLKGGGG